MRRAALTFVAKLFVIAAIVCLSASARAEPVVAAGLWCDTPEQMQQVARAENPQAGLSAVNASKEACRLGVILVEVGGVVADFYANRKHYQVVEMHVHGIILNEALAISVEMKQYGLQLAKDEEV